MSKDHALPSVAIVTVNYNGKEHLQSCFEALRQLNYPQDKIEIICVDNNSSDGSVEFVNNNFPEVRCLEAGTNLGFAKGCNVGARQTQSDYLAFVNTDARVHPDWLITLVEALRKDEKAVCAAAKILDWEGKSIDFVEGHLNFYGFARQIEWRTEVEPNSFEREKPILFPSGGAMLIDRHIFSEVGGFDEDYFMFYEDVDLGWRLWILGYNVIFVPDAITYHQHHGSHRGISKHRMSFLHERNALATIIKNYEQSYLDKILPAALFLAAHRTTEYLRASNLDPEALSIPETWFNLPNGPSNQSVSIHQLAPLMAIRHIVANMSTLMQRRQAIQAKRKRSDQDIVKLFGQPFHIYSLASFFDAAYPLAQADLVEAFRVNELFGGVGKRVLLLTNCGLPRFGFSPSPEGERAEWLSHGLAARGHEILYAMPATAITDYPVPTRFKKLAWHPETMEDVIFRVEPDVVIVCHWFLVKFLKSAAYRPIVVDYFPQKSAMAKQPDQTMRQQEFLSNVDLFICDSEDQKEALRLWLRQEGIGVDPEGIQVASPNNPEQGIEPLAQFCQNPSMRRDKLKITRASVSTLPAKAWQALQENGLNGLKKNLQQYITWRLKLLRGEG